MDTGRNRAKKVKSPWSVRKCPVIQRIQVHTYAHTSTDRYTQVFYCMWCVIVMRYHPILKTTALSVNNSPDPILEDILLVFWWSHLTMLNSFWYYTQELYLTMVGGGPMGCQGSNQSQLPER